LARDRELTLQDSYPLSDFGKSKPCVVAISVDAIGLKSASVVFHDQVDMFQVADQFQGMYALTRGLCLAFLAAAAYYAGISLWGLYRQHAVQWAWLVPFFFGCLWLTVARANPRSGPKRTAEGSPMRASAGEAGEHTDEATQESRKRREQQRREATAAVLSLVVMGAAVAIFMPVRPNRFEAFGAAVPFLLLFALKMYRVSREQDSNVAKTVLNDFLVEPPAKRPEGENDNKSS